MIKNFEETRQQLADLAQVLNTYKSEAVQLRLVELIFGESTSKENPPVGKAVTDDAPAASIHAPARKKSRRKAPSKAVGAEGTKPQGTKTRTPRTGGSRKGARAVLADLVSEGFFKTPKTIGQIVAHCDHNLASKFGSNEFSGTLARYVRDKKLKRAKNTDGQYQYTEGA